uniref:Uncharacterized protein n=1 Tax=Palpitomonas bilix TaxID=652834 RepID=A0A7S3LWD7_9EUKA|mmetsp:Transcript_6416/g.15814  ORF Transcript_6416/g.15814 Transcript_6416/m.15814 type:complete len:131 (+) Transcript_6416:123-515(+)
MFNMQFRFRAALALVWIAFLSSVDSRCLPESDQLVPTRSSAYSIKLGDNSWDSAILNDVVAKILLEEVLGYPTSRVAATGGRAQWEDIENDVFDTILEVSFPSLLSPSSYFFLFVFSFSVCMCVSCSCIF